MAGHGRIRRTLLALALAGAVSAACSSTSTAPSPAREAAQPATAAATPSATPVSARSSTPTSSPVPTPTADRTPTPAPLLTPTPRSTPTPLPTPTSLPRPTLRPAPSPTPAGPFSGCPGDTEAHRVYNRFWRTLDRRYAVFAERLPAGATWDDLGRSRCGELARVAALADHDGPLFDLVMDLARELDDGHVTLDAPTIDRFDDAWVDVYPHDDQRYELEYNVEDRYLDGDLTWAGRNWFAWGRIGHVGYVSITSMEGFSRVDDEDVDVARAEALMARILDDFDGTSGMIIDVRANDGGWDAVSLAIAGALAGPESLAWSEQRRNGPAHDDHGDWVDVSVPAAGPQAYQGPVVVLTSGGTFSAAETFVLAAVGRAQTTILGEPTSGHLSDLIDGRLANGWTFTYSGERYRAADGMVYEAVGVPPDIEVPFDPDAFASGRDVMLEAALEVLNE